MFDYQRWVQRPAGLGFAIGTAKRLESPIVVIYNDAVGNDALHNDAPGNEMRPAHIRGNAIASAVASHSQLGLTGPGFALRVHCIKCHAKKPGIL